MKKIRILRLIARLNIGGPSIQAILLSSELNNSEFSTLLVTGVIEKDEGDMIYLAQKHGIIPTIIPEMGREIHWYDDLITLVKLIKIIRNYKPDIIHTHTAKAGTIGRLAAILTRIPVCIHTFHGHVFSGYFSSKKNRFFILIERFLAKFTQIIVAISPNQKLDLSCKYKIATQNKFKVIPLGLDLEPLLSLSTENMDSKTDFGLNTDCKVVSIIGRLVPIKNHELFIKSANLLVNQYKAEVQFLIVGDGECRSEIQQRVKENNLTERIHFIGWQSDMVKVYQVSDIVVLTSRNEGTPVSLIEAMAAGKPVVSTNVGGVKDVVSDGITGFVTPSNNEKILSKKILLLLNDKKLREQFGKEARKKAGENFSIKRLVNDVTSLNRELSKK